jgi:hypothetical protein
MIAEFICVFDCERLSLSLFLSFFLCFNNTQYSTTTVANMSCSAWPVGNVGYLCTSMLNQPVTGGALPLVLTRVVDTGAVCFAGSKTEATRKEFDVRLGKSVDVVCSTALD